MLTLSIPAVDFSDLVSDYMENVGASWWIWEKGWKIMLGHFWHSTKMVKYLSFVCSHCIATKFDKFRWPIKNKNSKTVKRKQFGPGFGLNCRTEKRNKNDGKVFFRVLCGTSRLVVGVGATLLGDDMRKTSLVGDAQTFWEKIRKVTKEQEGESAI